jgi:hypothetical protein
VRAEGEHGVGEHRPAVVGHQHVMCVRRGHAVAGSAIGLGCRRSALRCGCADG